MSTPQPLQLPNRLLDWLNCRESQAVAVPLVSVDDSGFPHAAMLSWFEVVTAGGSIYFFLRMGSRTARNLAKRPGALLFVTPEFVFYLKGAAIHRGTKKGHDLFRFQVSEVKEDLPHREEAGVAITSGVTFSDANQIRRARLRLRQEMRGEILEGSGDSGSPGQR